MGPRPRPRPRPQVAALVNQLREAAKAIILLSFSELEYNTVLKYEADAEIFVRLVCWALAPRTLVACPYGGEVWSFLRTHTD